MTAATIEKTPKAKRTTKAETNGKSAKPAKKAPAAAKASTADPRTAAARAESLTKPQVRILATLAKLPAGNSLNGATLAERAEVPATWVVGHTFKACGANTAPALCERAFAKAVEIDSDGRKERCYQITPAGRKVLAKILAAK